MKLILLSALIVSIIGSFGDCAYGTDNGSSSRLQQSDSLRSSFRNRETGDPSYKKTVSFNNRPKFVEPADINEETVFSTNLKKFKKNLLRKSKEFAEGSAEYHFLNALFIVVEKNHEMFNTMFRHVAGLRSSDSVLCQSDGDIPFPSEEILENIVSTRDWFENSLIDIMISLNPAYDFIEQLVGTLDLINGNLKIDPKLLMEMNKEAVVVNEVHQQFVSILKDDTIFPMRIYRRHIRDIRRIICIDSEQKGGIQMASAKLNNELIELDAIYPKLVEAFNFAVGIDFNALVKATTRFSALVKKALASKKPVSIEDTMRQLKIQEAKLTGKQTMSSREEVAANRAQMASSIDRAINSLRAQEAKLVGESVLSRESSSSGHSSSMSFVRSSSSLSSGSSSSSGSSGSSVALGDGSEDKKKKSKSFFGSLKKVIKG